MRGFPSSRGYSPLNKLATRLMIEATRLIIAVAKLIFSLFILMVLTSCSLLTVYIITDLGYSVKRKPLVLFDKV